MGLTQEHYELYTFLTDCVYSELAYPSQIGFNERVVKGSGLRLEIFELIDRKIIIICGTNSLKDWLTNIKVGLGFTPHQHKQALKIVKREIEECKENGKFLIICGHSLGGGIAEYCLANIGETEFNNYYGITYNGCGVKHLKGQLNEGKILNITTSKDILNGITTRLPFRNYLQHYGRLNIIKDTTTWNPIKSHCNFEVMMKYQVNTNSGKE